MGFLGYHYAFANYIDSERILKETYHLTSTTKHENIIKSVMKKHFDIGIVSKSFLNDYLNSNKNVRKNILISNFYDQTYKHRILYRKNSKGLSKAQMNKIQSLVKEFYRNKRKRNSL
jgi:hypothetical protein